MMEHFILLSLDSFWFYSFIYTTFTSSLNFVNQTGQFSKQIGHLFLKLDIFQTKLDSSQIELDTFLS